MTFKNGTGIAVIVHQDGTCSIAATFDPDPDATPPYTGEDPLVFPVTQLQAMLVNAAPAGTTIDVTTDSATGAVTAVLIRKP